MKTRATRAVLAFLERMVSSPEIPIQITVEAGILVGKLKRECKANGVKLTKRRKRRKRTVATPATEANTEV